MGWGTSERGRGGGRFLGQWSLLRLAADDEKMEVC